ncbi:hypothetical protein DER46DRAFT_389191 [Fusarium sp. MPI-SDFR-AT-0072]|nr:hypothetical protein DER46DRAFT_389191 [Fusarium sp. MPI-SDFR-AT-0072]
MITKLRICFMTPIKTIGKPHNFREFATLWARYPIWGRSLRKREVAAMLRNFAEKLEKGVVLDICFKPRRTSMVKLGESFKWPGVEGTHVIGY